MNKFISVYTRFLTLIFLTVVVAACSKSGGGNSQRPASRDQVRNGDRPTENQQNPEADVATELPPRIYAEEVNATSPDVRPASDTLNVPSVSAPVVISVVPQVAATPAGTIAQTAPLNPSSSNNAAPKVAVAPTVNPPSNVTQPGDVDYEIVVRAPPRAADKPEPMVGTDAGGQSRATVVPAPLTPTLTPPVPRLKPVKQQTIPVVRDSVPSATIAPPVPSKETATIRPANPVITAIPDSSLLAFTTEGTTREIPNPEVCSGSQDEIADCLDNINLRRDLDPQIIYANQFNSYQMDLLLKAQKLAEENASVLYNNPIRIVGKPTYTRLSLEGSYVYSLGTHTQKQRLLEKLVCDADKFGPCLAFERVIQSGVKKEIAYIIVSAISEDGTQKLYKLGLTDLMPGLVVSDILTNFGILLNDEATVVLTMASH